jgi:hypothetical protein
MSRTMQTIRRLTWIVAGVVVATLAGCGGGGGDQGCVDRDPTRNPALPSCAGSGVPGTPGIAQSSLTLTLTDTAGATTTTITPASPGILKAVLRDSKGVLVPGVAVTFKTTDTTGKFNPESGSALTNGQGVAQVTLLSGTAAGAYTVTATTPGTTTGTVVTVGDDGNTLVFTDITAGSASVSYAVNVPAPPTVPLGSIKFVSASPINIALKGTGGVGRQEFSTLTFQVFDQVGQPVRGAPVAFTLNTTVGGLSVQPQTTTSDANGRVTTAVSSGTIPTPIVIVTATVQNTAITTVSNVLVISTGLAVNARTSGSATIGNFEGWNYDGCMTKIMMSMGDHFGNPAPDGTAVSFSASHGIIGGSCLTGKVDDPDTQTTNSAISGVAGACSIDYCSAGNRPPRGLAVVLGYLRGEEDFFDANGNNVCDGCTSTTGPEFTRDYDLPLSVFRDDNQNGRWDAGEPCIAPDASSGCVAPADGLYNGVLANPKIPDAQQTTYLKRSFLMIWSGSTAYITATPPSVNCGAFSPPGSGLATIHFRIVDLNGNPLPAGTTITFTGAPIVPGTLTSFKVANYLLSVGQRFGTGAGEVRIDEYDIPVACATGIGSSVSVEVKTPMGVVTRGTVPVN